MAYGIIAAWFLGQLLTDRFWLSQWLWWIPTPVALLAVALGIVLAVRRAKQSRRGVRRVICWMVCGLAILAYFITIEHQMFRRAADVPSDSSALKVVHWNVAPETWGDMEPSIDAFVALNADITVLTNPAEVLKHERTQPWLAEGREVISNWPFAVATRVPVRSMRVLIHVDGMYVTMIEFDATERLGRSLVMYLVDLPSDPLVGRMAVMRRLRRLLDERNVPPADVVVGDFNIPRGAASIRTAFPNMRYAFDEAGHGYAASFHRRLPLWHIDHTLLGPNVQAMRYDLIDPGISRHRAQVAWIAAER
jgi:hypothetical protein